MSKVTVIVTREELTSFLAFAGQKGLLHLITIPEKGAPEGTRPYESTGVIAKSAALRSRLLTIGSVLKTSERTAPEPPTVSAQTVEEMAEYLDKEATSIEHRVKALEGRREKLEAEKQRYSELARFLAGLEKLGVRLDLVGSGGFSTIIAGEAPTDSVPAIRDELDRLTYENTIFAITGSAEKAETFLAVFPSAFQEEARQAATSLGAKLELSLGELPTDPSEARKKVDQTLQEIHEREKQFKEDLDTLTVEHGPRYQGLSLLSEILDLRAKVLSQALRTDSTVLLQAWVPTRQTGEFERGAVEACGGAISMHAPETTTTHAAEEHAKEPIPGHVVEESETPPTLVDIPSWTKPLQSVITNFGTPAYHEFNPLVFMIITYPIVYGLMFGDVGQGILLVLFGLFLWRLKKRKAKIIEMGEMFMSGAELIVMLGIGVIVFGIVFGDVFGFEPDILKLRVVHGERVPLFSPSEFPIDFLVITLFIGVAHITFGLILNVYNKVRNKAYRHALLGPVMWIVFYISGVYIVSQVVLAGFRFGIVMKDPTLLGLMTGGVVVPLALMAWEEGGLHMFEAFLSSASNTLSYLRIWALNIADFQFKTALFIALGIGGALIANLLVLLIEALIVFVQTLRLHWVEWFSKFYEGTGIPWAPYQEPIDWNVATRG